MKKLINNIPIVFISLELCPADVEFLQAILLDGVELSKRTNNEELSQFINNMRSNEQLILSKPLENNIVVDLHVYEVDYLLNLVNIYMEKYLYEDKEEEKAILCQISDKLYSYYNKYNSEYIEPFWKENDTVNRIKILKILSDE